MAGSALQMKHGRTGQFMTEALVRFVAAILVVQVFARAAEAQATTPVTQGMPIGSSAERYARSSQALGMMPASAWSIRPFSRIELDTAQGATDTHLWAKAPSFSPRANRAERASFQVRPLQGLVWYNTTLPYGLNDGPVWAGRGLTSSISTGFSVGWGAIDIRLEPVAFWSQNARFPSTPSLVADASPFSDPDFPSNVDRPQRFGSEPYARLDAGQSSVTVSGKGLTVGASTSSEWWGPMTEFPFVLGNNAPGIPRVFFGTQQSLDIGIGRIAGRMFFGRLEESDFSPDTTGDGRRFTSGAVLVFQPRGFPGLEVGLSRLFHAAWPDSGLTGDYFTHLFEALLKGNVGRVFAPDPATPTTSTDNQLASVFARWLFPKSGFEIYGELGKEDHNADSRDLAVEPDHAASVGLGVGKAWLNGRDLLVARMELINFQASTLARHRRQGGTYIHSNAVQGHTHRGQLLGAGVAIGSGAASVASLERFTAVGSTRVTWMRQVIHDQPFRLSATTTQHALSAERMWFHCARASEFRAGVDAVLQLDARTPSDRFNARASMGWAWYIGTRCRT
jgi:hypothetical protein